MRMSIWMAAKAVVEVIFGIGFVLMPAFMLKMFGMEPNDGARLMGQLFGTAFIFGSIVLWLARNVDRDDAAGRAIMIGVVVSNAVGFIVCLMATLNKVWSALGWLPVALFLVFGLAFAYFLFVKPPAAKKR